LCQNPGRPEIRPGRNSVFLILIAFALLNAPAFAEPDGKALFDSGRHSEAIAAWRKAVEQRGDAEAAFRLGDTFEAGAVVEENLPEAAKWYAIAATVGHAGAQAALGAFYEAGAGVKQSLDQAMHWYGQCAAHNNAACQFNLGRLYSSGEPARQDLIEAYKWYYLAARGGQIPFDSDEFTALAGRMTAEQKRQAMRRVAAFTPLN